MADAKTRLELLALNSPGKLAEAGGEGEVEEEVVQPAPIDCDNEPRSKEAFVIDVDSE